MGLSVCLFLTGALKIPAVGQMLQQQNLFYSSASWIQTTTKETSSFSVFAFIRIVQGQGCVMLSGGA